MRTKNEVKFKTRKKQSFFFAILFVFVLFLGTGYAQTTRELSLTGIAALTPTKEMIITDVNYTSNNNADPSLSHINNFTLTTLSSSIVLNNSSNSSITYTITLVNNTNDQMQYMGTTYDPDFYDNLDITFDISGLNVGDVLNANEQRTITITFRYANQQASYNNTTLNSFIKFDFKKLFNITYTNITQQSSYPTTVVEGGTLTVTFANNNAPEDIQVVGSTTSTTYTKGTDFTYNNRTLTFNNVTEDLQVVGVDSSGNIPCLTEGTDVLLWNGTTKKIEDVTYNDLLKVWNHDTGTYGYEYAAWIEQVGARSSYIKVTFSDGSVLKIVGDHSVFSVTKNRYVNINSDELNVGDVVVKLTNGIQYVVVTNIEQINEPINSYHVISTRYFNLITNNILTTYEIYNNVSNFMGFDANLKWQNTEIVRSDMFTYDDFSYLDKYIYKTFRLEETKYLLNTGLVTQEEFNDLFYNYLMNNDKKVLPPTDINGNRLWMVTTSDDTNLMDTSHQYIEGSSYVVPNPVNSTNFIHWYNHSDNKLYNPGDILEVDSGIYLEAIYQ